MGKIKIVIADNDEDEILFARDGFNSTGLFDVIAIAETGDELLAVLQSLKPGALPHVILSDLNMPGKSGLDILTAIKNDPELAIIPVYISSTSSTNTTINKCIELGAKAYLIKPETYSKYDEFAKELYVKLDLNK